MTRWINTEKIIIVVFFAFLILYPFIGSNYGVNSLSHFLAMVLLASSVWLIWGITGIFSFGQTAFFGVGAYTYAIISMNSENLNTTIIATIATLLITWLIAFIIGYFIFYGGVNDVFVGLITLCITLFLDVFLGQTAGSKWKIGDVALGGYNGITGIPPLTFDFGESPILFNGNLLYYFIVIIIILLYIIFNIIQTKKIGYSLISIRENRERSQLLGSNTALIQTFSFGAGGVLAALGGITYVFWGGYISPASMDISAAALPVVLVAAAGRKNLAATIIFVTLYYFISERLSASGSEYALVILGAILVLVILFVPEGIVVYIFNFFDKVLFKKGDK